MAYSKTAREKEIENKLRKDFFSEYDAEETLGDIDFAVAIPQNGPQLFEQEFLLWAEAKRSNTHDIKESIVQLILTIGKARTFDHHLPPAYLGAFDAEKIAFVPYYAILDVFSFSFINWQVAPSNHDSDTFRLVMELIGDALDREMTVFNLTSDERELRTFIRRNFVCGKSKTSKIRINKTNFTAIYQKWLVEVKPSIAVNWDLAKSSMILDADFYLADIMSKDNVYLTLKDKLRVLLKRNHYELDREVDEMGLFKSREALFKDKQKAHTRFWNRYQRPPLKEYRDYIVTRRDLLVPQDIRERKGSFFTPAQWVSLSQEYLAKELGENWQEEYYIWDCCAGTGNLLANLTNKYNIWASTLDKADVDVMHDRIRTMNNAGVKGHEGSNLLDSHVFQFDFLNAPFTKLPEKLQEIVNDPEKRKKLIIYINPPYAEASNARTVSGTGSNRPGLSISVVKETYKKQLGRAANELFAQFFARIAVELDGCKLAVFSKLKTMQGPNFTEFRKNFPAQLRRMFIVPANTFDNVKGSFPIGFQIWDTGTKEEFRQITTDVYNSAEELIGKKNLYAYNNGSLIIDWLHHYDEQVRAKHKQSKNFVPLAYLRFLGTDFQNNNGVFWTLSPSSNDLKQVKGRYLTYLYVTHLSVYFAVRLCIAQSWLNDRDQFLFPDEGWQDDKDFQGDCLVFTLFHGQNRISCEHGINHFIPFSEEEVDAKEVFTSHFMKDYLSGLIRKEYQTTPIKEGDAIDQDLFDENATYRDIHFPPLPMSEAATAVMHAGRAVWRYYHDHAEVKTDASLYDIRLFFQGTHKDAKGKKVMNNESDDPRYNSLMAVLRMKMRQLAEQIETKIYAYGFLKRNYEPLLKAPSRKVTKPEVVPPFDEEAIADSNNNKGESDNRVINITIENHYHEAVGTVVNVEKQ